MSFVMKVHVDDSYFNMILMQFHALCNIPVHALYWIFPIKNPGNEGVTLVNEFTCEITILYQ